jgi:hypothetical protein
VILFDEYMVEVLKSNILNQHLDSVSLTSFGLDFRFCDTSIHCTEHVFAKIEGEIYEWDDAPNSAPWGMLVRQKVQKVLVSSAQILRIVLFSGDYIDIETVEGGYESVVMRFPSREDTHVMVIFQVECKPNKPSQRAFYSLKNTHKITCLGRYVT